MPRNRRHIRRLATGALAATLLVGACGSDDSATEVPPDSPSATTLDDASSASASAAPPITDSTTAPSSKTATRSATSTISTPSPTPAPTTTSAAASGEERDDTAEQQETSTRQPTTPPDAGPEAVRFVQPDDPTRSAAVFGFEYGTFVDPDEVLTTIAAELGEPDHDSGWQPMPATLPCKADAQYRSILWDDLRIVLERLDDEDSRLGAWSVGETTLSFSPPLAAQITRASGVTSASGLGIGSPTDAIADEGFSMVGPAGDRVPALSGVSPVIFEIDDGTVTAFSIEDNDCFADNDGM